MSKNRLLDFEDKIDLIVRSLLKSVWLDVCILLGDIFFSHYANGAWMNILFMVGAAKEHHVTIVYLEGFQYSG